MKISYGNMPRVSFKGEKENINLANSFQEFRLMMLDDFTNEYDEDRNLSYKKSLTKFDTAADDFVKSNDPTAYNFAENLKYKLLNVQQELKKIKATDSWLRVLQETEKSAKKIYSKLEIYQDSLDLNKLARTDEQKGQPKETPKSAYIPQQPPVANFFIITNEGLQDLASKRKEVKSRKEENSEDDYLDLEKNGIENAHYFVLDLQEKERPYFDDFLANNIDEKEPYFIDAEFSFKTKDYYKAEDDYCKNLIVLANQLDDCENKIEVLSKISKTFERLGDLYSKTNRPELAEELYDNAITVYNNIYSPSRPEILKELRSTANKQSDLYLDKILNAPDEATKNKYKAKIIDLRRLAE